MKLEGFFTSTEMSNGLTTPSRVQELVSIMQKERDSVVKNAGEITKQWSAVASTIAATGNKECLELFIQLDGLCFIGSWLKDALRFGSETDEYFVDESISHLIDHLLQAVERLHVDDKKSVSSGIWPTVKSLLGHKSSKVQERAKKLFDSWDKGKDDCVVSVGIEKVQASIDDRTRETVNLIGENGLLEPSGEEKSKEHVGSNNRVGDTSLSDQNIEHTRMKDAFPGSSLSNSVTEGQKVEHPTYHGECATNANDMSNTCTSAVTKLDAVDEQKDVPASTSINHSNHIKEVRSSEKFTDVRDDLDAIAGSDLQTQTDVYNENNCSGKSSFDDASVAVPKGNTPVDDSRPENHGSSKIVIEAKENRKYNHDVLQDSDKHNIDSVIGWADKNTSDDSEDDMENEVEFQEADKGVFQQAENGGKDSGVIGKKSDIDLDYGFMDPLELARQVAIEVEREVQSCSSSEKIEESKVHEPGSPDSISAKQRQKIEEVSRRMSPLTEASLANSEARPINGTVKVESSQVVDATLDLETNVEKDMCNFDLNLEVCSDDIDSPGNPISTSVSVVSASRAAAAPGVPVTPLQFEGTLGWKGSAATSAFRPCEKSVSSGNDSSSKQMQCFHDIDLNVSDGGDDRVADLFPEKQVSISSALPLGKSSLEASPRKSEMLEFDLNFASEEGEAPSDWRIERTGTLLSLRNGHLSRSPSSSSSSKQPSLRNFDLNDQSSFLNDFSDLNNFKKPPRNSYASGGIKSSDSVVSIMGMKVEVNRKDFSAQSFPFPNSRITENAVEHNVARGGGVLGMGSPFQCTPLPAFGYSGIAPVPPMAFSSSMYGPSGPIHYMVDSRGPPVVPQIGGSFPQQSFVLSMGSPPVPNGVWPSQSGLDLDTGLILDRGNKDVGGLRQLFDQGQARPIDEHFRIGLQPSTSLSIGGKRKAPDGGWESSPFKHHPPQWK
ncbi:hypothetical protein RND71_026957 [Anisodus tanguticus]|uniref:TFIIS N-terminal domain-containing protein n=1 Tax=Anisodus tanguticus TaxID=243964 RepID=A0AAE1RN56_9SOLA|nr:hypothetical protein RND71_026957 [Anisodus tanguticus]